MHYNHRNVEQVKQAERLEPKGKGRREEVLLSFLLHSHHSPVDSICLKERKTSPGNGITLKPVLVVGRSDEQATRPQAA
jgi:hypothetical protein